MRLKDKTAIITGASRGIGHAIALSFAKEGAKVVLAARSTNELEKMKSEITDANGECLVVKVDIRKREDVKLMAQKAYETFGRIDVLVNNAGYPLFGYPIDSPEDEAEDRYEAIMETNLRGYWYSARFVIPYMKENKKGSIINISSVRGHGGLANESAYCAAKGGVGMLNKALAIELAPYNIRVNNISPGAIQVDIGHWVLSRYGDEVYREYIQKFEAVHLMGMKMNQPLNVIGEPMDVAYAAIFLASDEAKFVTGADIVVDGGLTSLLAEPGALDLKKLDDLYVKSKEMMEWLSYQK